MPTPQQKINDQLSSRLNSLESKVDETNGYLKGVVESNEKLIELLKKRDTTMGRIIWALIVLLFFAVGVIAFGAIGKDGMHSVRQTMPLKTAAIPMHNDFDKWRYRA